MARPEIVEAAAGAVWASFIVQPDEVFSPQNADEIAEAVLAVVEPMIRQDERERVLEAVARVRESHGMYQTWSTLDALESEINQLAGKAET